MYKKSSILNYKWLLKKIDERKSLYISQKYGLSDFLSKIICSIDIDEELINEFLNPNLENQIPNPFQIKDMNKSVSRAIKAIEEKQKIGILADYDVDGSTSAAILFKFFHYFNLDVSIKVPNRLSEGYGPNQRIMNDFIKENINILFVLDCGTTSLNILDQSKYPNLDIVVIDHHISDNILPNVFSLVNPNRYDDTSNLKNLAAVGVTYLFLIALRKELRNLNFFESTKEPNLLNFLDLVALGTVCDVVSLIDINRIFVNKGLEVIIKRQSKSITSMLDNSNLNSKPNVTDLGYLIGPQINAASRLGFSDLPHKLLISDDINEIDNISKKLILLNEKRKLIENQIYEEALIQCKNFENFNFILIYGDNWHCGVLGIIASRLLKQFFKPIIIISFQDNVGTGSARSIEFINLGNLILEAKNRNILISGGGHNLAAGLKIDKKNIPLFKDFLIESLKKYDDLIFEKNLFLNDRISLNQINYDLVLDLKKLQPFGNGNEEPIFVLYDIDIESFKIIKDKHILVFFKTISGKNLKGICFNSVNTIIEDYLKKYRNYKFEIAGTLHEDNYNSVPKVQIIIKDLMLLK